VWAGGWCPSVGVIRAAPTPTMGDRAAPAGTPAGLRAVRRLLRLLRPATADLRRGPPGRPRQGEDAAERRFVVTDGPGAHPGARPEPVADLHRLDADALRRRGRARAGH